MSFSNSSGNAYQVASTKNLTDPDEKNARVIDKKLRVAWGRASASHLKSILTDADGVGATALKVVDSVVAKCDVRAAFYKAPHVPVAGTSLLPVQ